MYSTPHKHPNMNSFLILKPVAHCQMRHVCWHHSPESSQSRVKLQDVCLMQRSRKICGPPQARIGRRIYANQHPNGTIPLHSSLIIHQPLPLSDLLHLSMD